ncbi:MAG TPA: methyltransferase domain-containing protein [Candidatus Saccharimonadia bacterium]|nr:methyltransferase domain-containing protein [Candidatus Saccharimonadia bacterium]
MQYDETLWRNYAKVYDTLLEIIPYRNLLLEVVDSAQIKGGQAVLDTCCGTGNLLWALQHQNINCQFTGVDASSAMLAKAQAKTPAFSGTAEFCRMDLHRPLEAWKITGSFDRFILNNCVFALDNPALVLQNLATFARPGAILVLSTPHPSPSLDAVLDEHLRDAETAGRYQEREDALQQLVPLVEPIIRCNQQIFRHYGDELHFPNRSQLEQWFEHSGWKITDIRTTYAGQNWLVTAEKV